jgi:hypothetical protein
LYRKLGRPQSRSGRVRKISPPPGFDPRTLQPVASRGRQESPPNRSESIWKTYCKARRHGITVNSHTGRCAFTWLEKYQCKSTEGLSREKTLYVLHVVTTG